MPQSEDAKNAGSPVKAVSYTAFALTAFAFNSILCRLALGAGAIDAASFTSVRLVSGFFALSIIAFFLSSKRMPNISAAGRWVSGLFLFAYAVTFSFAYNGLTTATGALILFGSVQLTMFAVSIIKGEKPGVLEWCGLITAFGGLVYLVLPGLESPPLVSSLLMAIAGAAWGFYTLKGKESSDPLLDTMGNFYRAMLFALVVSVFSYSSTHFSWFGFWMAVFSGAIASGVGYAVWYAALRFHSAARAAVLQLSVPLIAAAGGVIIVSEPISTRLPIAAVLVLGGISATIFARK
ncbi:MAG: DMT family transporter [Pyrinomonadaceae bacterium]|nr:DMT family transporter [Pyrinomonadaceae bacterium]